MSTVHIPNHQGVVNGVGLYSVSMHAESPYGTYDSDVPDPAWAFTDAAGHFHAYDSDGKLPTLTRVLNHVDCDGSCGGVCDGAGYSRTEYQCPLCDEYVVPATRKGRVAVNTREPLVTVEVTGPTTLAGFDGEMVSFSCAAGFGSGELRVVEMTMSSSADYALAQIDMRTPLYRRYGTRMQQEVREPRANLTQAILAGAQAVRAAWGALPRGVPADDFTIDFSALAATRAITAALPLLGLDGDGEILP